MDHRLLSDSIIDAIDKLNRDYQNRAVNGEKGGEKETNSRNPIVGIITPEWYYSESFKIFENIDVNWNNLDKFELVHNMVKSIEKTDNINSSRYQEEFERGFSSWYQAYHYLPRTKWGIHIRYDAWLRIASKFYHTCPSLISKTLDSIKAAFLYLYIHQLFHYLTENAASTIELDLGDVHLYTRYFYNIYIQDYNSSNCIEESLANRYLFGRVDECNIDKQYVKEELSKQGPGYREFINYLGSEFIRGNRRLLMQIKKRKISLDNAEKPLEQIIDISNPIDYAHGHRVPVWLHRKAKPVFINK